MIRFSVSLEICLGNKMLWQINFSAIFDRNMLWFYIGNFLELIFWWGDLWAKLRLNWCIFLMFLLNWPWPPISNGKMLCSFPLTPHYSKTALNKWKEISMKTWWERKFTKWRPLSKLSQPKRTFSARPSGSKGKINQKSGISNW